MLTPFDEQRLLLLLLVSSECSLLLSVSSKCCQKPGDVGFYEVLPLDCLLYNWLASRAYKSGWVNDYWLVCWLVGW
jgi:hypothetical protein